MTAESLHSHLDHEFEMIGRNGKLCALAPWRLRARAGSVRAGQCGAVKTSAPDPPEASAGHASAVERRGAYGWFIAGVGSWFASWGMQGVLFSWLLVGELKAEAELVGTAQMCQMLPALLLLLVAGATADRHDRRKLLMALHTTGAAITAAMAVLVGAGLLSFGALVTYAICMGAVGAFVWPARDSLLSEVARGDLMQAVTGMTMTQFGLQAVGALIAGSARWMGSAPALGMQAAVLLLGVLPLSMLPARPGSRSGVRPAEGARATAHPAPPELAPGSPAWVGEKEQLGDGPRRRGGGGPGQTWREIVEGLREVWRSPRLRSPVLLVIANGVFFIGPFFVVFPLLVRDFYGGDAANLSLVYMSFPIGTITGSLVLLLRHGIRRKGRALLIALMGGSICLAAVALGLPFWGFVLLVFAWGLCGSVFFNTSRTLVQQAAPATHRARVLSVYGLGVMGTGPIGALLSGLLATIAGSLGACALAGMAMLIVVLVAWVFTGIRRLE